MSYSLADTKIKLDRFSDKMGSDYFTLPVLMNFFETATLDFIGERLKHIEKTQTIRDDISSLIVPKNLMIILDPNITTEIKYIAALPIDYLRLVSYDIIYTDKSICRRADLLTHSEKRIAVLNPNRKPTKNYPIITQEASQWQIDSGKGGSPPAIFKLTYCKKPKYALTSNTNERIVNLPDDSIEQIILKTIKLLFNKTSDERRQSSYQIEETYRKMFK